MIGNESVGFENNFCIQRINPLWLRKRRFQQRCFSLFFFWEENRVQRILFRRFDMTQKHQFNAKRFHNWAKSAIWRFLWTDVWCLFQKRSTTSRQEMFFPLFGGFVPDSLNNVLLVQKPFPLIFVPLFLNIWPIRKKHEDLQRFRSNVRETGVSSWQSKSWKKDWEIPCSFFFPNRCLFLDILTMFSMRRLHDKMKPKHLQNTEKHFNVSILTSLTQSDQSMAKPSIKTI